MCTLKVHGSDPRLARFGQDWGLPLCSTLEDGQTVYRPGGKRSSRLGNRGEYGFRSVVSNRDWSDLTGQFADAVAFLTSHREALSALSDLNPEHAVLDFPAQVDPSQRHVILFDVTVPVALSRASAEVDLAVEITLYFAPRERSAPSESPPGRGDDPHAS